MSLTYHSYQKAVLSHNTNKNELRTIKKMINNEQKPQSTIPRVMGSASKKPHCWGKMKWILKYPSGMEPPTSICRCEHGALKCKLLTRQSARQHCT